MAVTPLIAKTYRRLGELVESGSTSLIHPTQVGEELRDAARWVVSTAPLHALRTMTIEYNDAFIDPSKRLRIDVVTATEMYVQAPDDMARFVRIQAASWDIPAYDLLSDETATKYLGDTVFLDATQEAIASSPLCVLTMHRFPNEVILRSSFRLYPAEPVDADGTWDGSLPLIPPGPQFMDHFWYIPDPDPEKMPLILQDALIWDAVSRILQSDEDKAYLASQATQRRDTVLRAVVNPVKAVTYRRPIYLA